MIKHCDFYLFLVISVLVLSFVLIASQMILQRTEVKVPARCYEQGETIDGYIVEAVVSDTQLYATLPNDENTIYLLTISADKWDDVPFAEKPFERVTDYFSIVDVQIPNDDKSE